MIFEIYCNNFFQQTSRSAKCSLKQATRNFSGINFSYTNRLHFLLIIRVHFNKSLIYSKVQAARIMVK